MNARSNALESEYPSCCASSVMLTDVLVSASFETFDTTVSRIWLNVVPCSASRRCNVRLLMPMFAAIVSADTSAFPSLEATMKVRRSISELWVFKALIEL